MDIDLAAIFRGDSYCKQKLFKGNKGSDAKCNGFQTCGRQSRNQILMPRCMILCINRFSPGSRPAFEFNGTLPTLTYIYIYIFGWMGEVSHALTHSQRKGYDAFNIILTYIYYMFIYILYVYIYIYINQPVCMTYTMSKIGYMFSTFGNNK